MEASLELQHRRELRVSNTTLSKHGKNTLPVTTASSEYAKLSLPQEAGCLAAGSFDPKSLDSSVKRNSALIKKLRQLSEESKESLLSDIQKTNQSKYVSEAVAAITDASLKSKDISAAVQICCALHQRYPDFHTELVAALTRTCTPKAGQQLCVIA